MSASARQSKFNNRKSSQPDPSRRAPAWSAGARASPTFSPPNSGSPRPGAAQPPTQTSNFPPLNGATSKPNDDKTLQSLSGLTGTTVTLLTKTSVRYEGVVSSTSAEGDTTGVTLKDVREITTPGAPIKDSLFIASTNIASWSSGPAGATLTNGDSFRTDTDISRKTAPAPRERELQAWQPPPSSSDPPSSSTATGDELTFGSASTGWDQFAANEKLFGVKPVFDETAYTTTLDRNQPGFQEKERKAAKLANEIMNSASHNPHIAEERGQIVGHGEDEEDKYGAVVRGNGAYVPPGARKAGGVSSTEIPVVSVNAPPQSPQPSKASSPSPSATPNPAAKAPADPVPAFRDFVTNEKQRLTQRRQAMVKSDMDKRMAELVKFSKNFKLNKPMPDDLVPILAKGEEKQQAIRDKAAKDASSSQARNIGPSSTTVLPGARNPLQPTKAALDANKAPTGVKTTVPAAAAANSAATKAGAATTKPTSEAKKTNMVIQAIPPFRGAKTAAPQTAARPGVNGAAPGTQSSKQAGSPPNAARLNIGASPFRPNPNATAFTPGGSPQGNGNSVSPKPGVKEQAQGPPNPFFGNRQLKKTAPVNVKDDFNPFKHNKVADAATITAMWPYNGKRYGQMFPPVQHPPQPGLHSPHIPPGVPVGMAVPGAPVPGAPGQVGVAPGMPPVPGTIPPPPSYEEDQAQTQARGAYMYYPPYAYPQHMMGMPPGPPGAFMQPQYMQPMPYPPGMPPNAMYAPPGMQLPPGAYMPPPPPPPGGYPPPPNAGPRQSMPPTPIPAHAHPYYHSPQLQHAVPYPMMMPPPNAIPPHPYEGGAAPPVQMGGHA